MAGRLGPPISQYATLTSPAGITTMINMVPMAYPVLYDLDITLYVDGTVTSADEDNFLLLNGGGGSSVRLAYPILAANTGLPYVAKYQIAGYAASSNTPASMAAPRIQVNTGGAGTSGSVYHVTLFATPCLTEGVILPVVPV